MKSARGKAGHATPLPAHVPVSIPGQANAPGGALQPEVDARDDSPLACTGGRARKLTRRMTSFYEQHLRTIGLKLSQYSVLMNISTEPQTLLQLAAHLEMDRTTLTRNLRALVDAGWVRDVPALDARQRLLAVTPAGEKFRHQAQQVWRDAQLSLEARLGRDFVANLNAQLELALSQLKPGLPEEN